MRSRLTWAFGVWVALISSLPITSAAQQVLQFQSPILVIESDQLYRDSAFGQRIAAEVEEENTAIIAENQSIAEALEEEEKTLTEQRPSLEPDVFRELADAFDEKVQTIRRTQEAKARKIARKQEEARRDFLTVAAPILNQMMVEAGAAVIVERRNVRAFLNAVDITQQAIARVNTEIGDGQSLSGAAPQD